MSVEGKPEVRSLARGPGVQRLQPGSAMNDWIKDFLEHYEALGVGVLMVVENIFPPIPSEVVMPWAGYSVSQGNFSFLAAVAAGSVGSFAGALFWYWIGWVVGRERLATWLDCHGAWLTLSRSDLQRTEDWFARWGHVTVLLCRMIPGVRTFISVPAGLARMPLLRFSIYTAIGTILWTVFLAGMGWWLGDNYASLADPLGWVSILVVAILLAIWLYRLVRQQHAKATGKL
jgi:membrane protein DedA with SNARE-associated domain